MERVRDGSWLLLLPGGKWSGIKSVNRSDFCRELIQLAEILNIVRHMFPVFCWSCNWIAGRWVEIVKSVCLHLVYHDRI